MLSWVKGVLAHVKQKEKSRSNASVVSTISGGGEEPGCAKDSLHILDEEEFHKTNNDDHIRHLMLPTPPPSTSPLAPPSSHHSPSSPPSLITCLSSAPALRPSCVYPALPLCSQPPTPSNTRPTLPSSMPFLSPLELPTSQNTNANALSIPEPEMPLDSQQSLPMFGEDSSVEQENQSEDTLQAASGDVLGPTIDESSYPSCFLIAALTSAIGQLVTVHDEKYVLVRVMGKMLMVSLKAGSCNIPPCRVVWRAGRPVPLIELPDSTFVEVDAVVCPESKKLHAAVIWQDTKPERCLQLLDDTYLFLDSRSVTCWPSFEDILAKKLTVLGFDGTIVTAEVCDAIVFIGQAKATLVELLQHNLEQCNATVYKVLEGTGGGRVLYVCTCLWVGQKPPTSSLPMVINRQTLYTKEYHGFYTKTEKKLTLCLGVDASLCVSGGTAALQVDLDGSRRSLKATHPLGLEPGCQEAGETTRVSVHVNKGNPVAFPAVMIEPRDSTALAVILNEMPPWDLLSKTAPHCPSSSKDKPMKVCKSASARHNANGQQVTVSSSLKASVPVAQEASVPVEQNTPNTDAQKTPNTAAQNTPHTAAQNTPNTAAQNTPNTAAQNTLNTAAQKGSVPSTQNTSGTAAQKTSGKAAKTNKKSASLSQLSDTGQQQPWGYLSCRLLAADSCVAVVTGAGKKIVVAKEDLFVNEAPLTVKDNVASVLKKVKNINVIYTHSQEVHEVHGHSVDLVAVAAWEGKKPSFINNIVEQRLSALKKVAVPKVTQTPPATPKVTQTPATNFKMTPTPPAAPKGTPVSPAPLPAGATTVDATCMIMKISHDSVTLIVRSKFLPGNCGTAQARLCDMYDNGTPMTQTEAEKIRDKVWHCHLEIKNNGKQLMVTLAWRGMKPVNHASSRSAVSQQPRQALSTGDLTSSLSRPPGTAALVRQTPPSSPSKVLRGEVTEVLAKGGLLRGEDGRVYLFPLEVCFLFGVCLHQVEPSEVLHVGMTLEFEVTEGRHSRSNEVVEAAVQRVWIEGEDSSLAFPPTDSMIESWCSDNGVSSATRDALKQEAELLSPSLFPTALKMETTTTVDITS